EWLNAAEVGVTFDGVSIKLDGNFYAARRTTGVGMLGRGFTTGLGELDNAEMISRQWIATSPSTTENTRHDQITACTISTPNASTPVTPITNRAAMKTNATA